MNFDFVEQVVILPLCCSFVVCIIMYTFTFLCIEYFTCVVGTVCLGLASLLVFLIKLFQLSCLCKVMVYPTMLSHAVSVLPVAFLKVISTSTALFISKMNDLKMLFLVLAVASVIASAEKFRYVRPIDSSVLACPAQPCFTLEQYLTSSSLAASFNSGADFVFLAGNHYLEYSIKLEDVSNVSFTGQAGQQAAKIIFKEDGGVWFENISNLTVSRVTFVFNSTFSTVAFVISNSSGIRIINSTFQGNSQRTTAIKSRNTIITIVGCFFEDNAGVFSGALMLANSVVTLKRNIFLNNMAELGGGVINAANTTLSMVENQFLANKGKWKGGAISAENSVLNFTANNFTSNTAMMEGGAINVESCILYLTCDNFINNKAFRGGAISANASIVELTNATFLLNKANISGAAVFANNSKIRRHGRTVFVSNNVMWGKGPAVYSINGEDKFVSNNFDTMPERVRASGLTYPQLSSSSIPKPSIVAYYSLPGNGYLGFVASVNETKIILTGMSGASEKYLLYSVKNPKVLSFVNREMPVTAIDSISGRNGFLAMITAMSDARDFFTSLQDAINNDDTCSVCEVKFLGIGYFANNR